MHSVRCLAVCALLALLAVGAWPQAAYDIPPGHWAHDAVEELANKGLVLGYPDGRFLGDRALTRYEMAALVKRVLDRIDQHLQALPQPSAEAPQQLVTQQDLETVRKLVEEFKVELAVIGTKLDEVRKDLDSLREQVQTIRSELDEAKAAAQSASDVAAAANAQADKVQAALDAKAEKDEALQKEVAGLKKLKFSGYVQARFRSAEAEKSSFLVRRGRLKAAYSGERSSYTLQIDATERAVELRDAYTTWSPVAHMTLWAGHFKVPFGFEIEQSSSDREMPERTEVIRRLFPGERDRGLKLIYQPSSKAALDVGVFNGNGAVATPDQDNHKDVMTRVRYAFSPALNLGFSGYWGSATVGGSAATDDTKQALTGDFNGDGTPETIEVIVPGKPAVPGVRGKRNRFGIDLQAHNIMGGTIRGEWIKGKQPDSKLGSVDVEGWYALFSKPIATKWLFTTRYDVYDPNTAANSRSDRLSTWGFAITHHATANTKLTAAYELPKKQGVPGSNSVFTFQAQQKF